jgi:hypothetical protein
MSRCRVTQRACMTQARASADRNGRSSHIVSVVTTVIVPFHRNVAMLVPR